MLKPHSKTKGNYVILLHGMFHYVFYMSGLQKALAKEGYEIINLHYPIGKYSLEELSSTFLKDSIANFCADKSRKIHFVAYSLGGILVRRYLSDHAVPNLGKVVMIATPNKGSEIVDFVKGNFLYKLIFGVPGQELGKRKHSSLKSLPQKVEFELGIIAGSKSFNPFSYFLIKGKNDGLVSVESTKLEGMRDHIVIPASHFLMLYKAVTIKQMLHFLKTGKFSR